MAGLRHGAGVVSVLLALLALPASAEEQYVLWGDARKGHQAFVEKGCGNCHAIRGAGPSVGPDLGRIGTRHLAMTQVAGAAFLYAINLLDEPGSPRRGERLFVERGCATCHSVRGKGGTIGPSLERWKRYGSPVLWAELMWSHALGMEEKVREFGLPWPKFEDNDMVADASL